MAENKNDDMSIDLTGLSDADKLKMIMIVQEIKEDDTDLLEMAFDYIMTVSDGRKGRHTTL